jgi:hypothetical protein
MGWGDESEGYLIPSMEGKSHFEPGEVTSRQLQALLVKASQAASSPSKAIKKTTRPQA